MRANGLESRAPAVTATSSPAPSSAPATRFSRSTAPIEPSAGGEASDATDAEAAARAVLAGTATALPKDRSGAIEALRALTITRDSAVKATVQTVNQAKPRFRDL